MRALSRFAMLHHAVDGAVIASPIWGSGQQHLKSPMLAPGSAGDFRLAATDTGASNTPGSQDQGWLALMDASGTACWQRSFQSLPSTPRQYYYSMAAVGNLLAVCGTDSITDASGGVAQLIVFDLSESPNGYCTAKTNSQGCAPYVSFTGLSSVAQTSGFVVRTDNLLNQRPGLLIYGFAGAAATPFQGGTMCLAPPVRRTPGMNSSGNALPVHDCTGNFAFDFNAFAHGALGGNPSPSLLVSGTEVHVQAWARDPGFAPPNNTSLSNGLRFVLLP